MSSLVSQTLFGGVAQITLPNDGHMSAESMAHSLSRARQTPAPLPVSRWSLFPSSSSNSAGGGPDASGSASSPTGGSPSGSSGSNNNDDGDGHDDKEKRRKARLKQSQQQEKKTEEQAAAAPNVPRRRMTEREQAALIQERMRQMQAAAPAASARPTPTAKPAFPLFGSNTNTADNDGDDDDEYDANDDVFDDEFDEMAETLEDEMSVILKALGEAPMPFNAPVYDGGDEGLLLLNARLPVVEHRELVPGGGPVGLLLRPPPRLHEAIAGVGPRQFVLISEDGNAREDIVLTRLGAGELGAAPELGTAAGFAAEPCYCVERTLVSLNPDTLEATITRGFKLVAAADMPTLSYPPDRAQVAALLEARPLLPSTLAVRGPAHRNASAEDTALARAAGAAYQPLLPPTSPAADAAPVHATVAVNVADTVQTLPVVQAPAPAHVAAGSEGWSSMSGVATATAALAGAPAKAFIDVFYARTQTSRKPQEESVQYALLNPHSVPLAKWVEIVDATPNAVPGERGFESRDFAIEDTSKLLGYAARLLRVHNDRLAENAHVEISLFNVASLAPDQMIKSMAEFMDDSPRMTPSRTLIAGVISGMLTPALLQPIEVLKVRMQATATANLAPVGRRWVSGLGEIIAEGGLRSLYRGVVPIMLASGASWGLFFMLQALVQPLCLKGARDDLLGSIGPVFASSAIASAVTSALTNPLWLLKTRYCLAVPAMPPAAAAATAGAATGAVAPALSGAVSSLSVPGVAAVAAPASTVHGASFGRVGANSVRGVWDTLKAIVAEEGARGLFRGLPLGVLLSLQGAIVFSTVALMKELVRPDSTVSSFATTTTGVFFGRLPGTLLSYPIQVIRTRQQDARPSAVLRNGTAWQHFRHIARVDGLGSLWRGFTAHFVKGIPQSALVYFITDWTHRTMHAISPTTLSDDSFMKRYRHH